MIKNNKLKLIVSSLLILLPIPIGFIVKANVKTPVTLPWMAIFMPVFLLALHWLCMIITDIDNKKREQSKKVLGIVFWVCPVISFFTSCIFYSAMVGAKLNMTLLCGVIIGLSFILIGNYMPKCKQNNTIGIKIYWTLVNEENWNATHRFCGKVWVICGLLFLAVSFLPMTAFFAAAAIIFIPAVILPFIYSYLYHRKLKREGIYTESTGMLNGSKSRKLALLITLPVVVIATAFSLFVSFTGEIEPVYSEDSFTLKASFYEDATLFYDDIANIELRAKTNVGSRVIGIGSSRLFIGSFTNNEFGSYTRYTYTATESEIVIKLEDGRVFVINGKNEEDTKAIYETINGYIGG